ncbi:uncharacterized protein [Halyomorpha halys]|uniref:uncharacterized protein n=1 Tax=Halyomorpha halys TaxID=286706 RepID=UPI0006D510EA|nr:uncharacterized protein LOC106677633 [Halyomorpha halys]
MHHLRRGHILLRRCFNDRSSWRNYCCSNRHKEPRELSWQWSVKKGPELMKCKNINVSKVCPKPSFFPRFKKVFIPLDKKPCEKKKKPMSWKEYWSFLLPDQVRKPPLITCKKLQAERRRCCSAQSHCDECSGTNCCPPPKEWYGQAEIYVLPSSLPPIQEPPQAPEACGPPPPAEPSCVLALKGVCPIPKKSINMDDYAYKKAFSGINLCDEMKEIPSSFKVKGPCVPQLPDSSKSLRLSCGYFAEFKEVECPKAITARSTAEMPPLICKGQEQDGRGDSKEPKEINVEVSKIVCGRQTFLKPYKYGDKVPEPKKIHTLGLMKQKTKTLCTRVQSFHTTSQAQMKNHESSEGSRQQTETYQSQPNLEGGISHRINTDNTCQPAKSGVGLHFLLLKPLSGRLRDGLHAPPPACRPEDLYYNHNSQEIDPELSKLAEITKRNMSYGVQYPTTTKEKTTTTLAKELSKMAEERYIKKSKEKGVDRKPPTPPKPYYPPSKLTLLKGKKNIVQVSSKATFMTEAKINVKQAKKRKDKKTKKDKKKDFICAGCPGIKAAEEEERNPTPKSFLDCKVRPAGRCRGPQRKVHPDEGEPDSIYGKCRQKPYSLCNKPRPVIKKKERPYKMPCEENTTKRKFHLFSASQASNINKSGTNKFHSTVRLNDSSTNIPTIYDLLKVRGLNKTGKQMANQSNDWDSHTSESYGERNCDEYESLPDLSKYQPSADENGIKKMSYPINLWEYPDSKKKSNYNSWSNNEGNKILMGSKRKPILNITKDSNISVNSPPSKYNVLFNSISMKNRTESINKNTNHLENKPNNPEPKFKNVADFKEKNISNSKTVEYKNITENKPVSNASATKEMPPCPITIQNMWEDSLSPSTEQNSPASQEMKAKEKPKSQTILKDNLINECNIHSMFRPAEESTKVSTKPDNDSQSIYYQEKMLLSGPGNLENLNNTTESKED